MTANIADKQFEEIVLRSQNFDTIDKQFTEVLLELEGNDVLDRFYREYDQLHTSLVKSHEGERRLIKKCQELHVEITASQYKVRSAEDLSMGDKATIEALRNEILKAKQKLEQSREMEVTLREKIRYLGIEVQDLDRQVQKGTTGAQRHEAQINDLNRMKRDLQKEYEIQEQQMVAIRHDIHRLQQRVSKLEQQKAEIESQIQSIRDVYQTKIREIEHHRKQRRDFNNDLEALKEELWKKISESQAHSAAIGAGADSIQQLQAHLSEQRETLQRHRKLFEEVNKEVHSVEQESEHLEAQNKQIRQRARQQEHILKQKEAELASIRREITNVEKQIDSIQRANALLDIQMHDAIADRDAQVNELKRLELEKESAERTLENDRKQIEDLTRERDILSKSYLRAQGSTQKQHDWYSVKENQLRHLEHQIRGYDREAAQQRELIVQLTKETDQYLSASAVASQKYVKALDILQSHQQLIAENQKKIYESEGRLKQQQSLFESVLNERNAYSKQFIELNTQITSMEAHLEVVEQQISHLKDDISKKDDMTMKEDVRLQNLEKEKEEYRQKIKRTVVLTQAKERKLIQLNVEVNKLNQIITEAELEKAKQHRDCENVTNERDILGMQLIRRNDELAQLYERIRIQQSALKKGETQYRTRMLELTQFEEKMRLFRAQLTSIRSMASRLPEVKLLVNKTTKELNHARVRTRALFDECEKPTNIHRWRKMAGSQPELYRKHCQMRALQKELLLKQEVLREKSMLITEKEKLYLELKSVLSRQPGPEVAEQLNVYQETIVKKSTQLKLMKDSLTHFEKHLKHQESRYEELTDTMKALRTSYKLERKRSEKQRKRQQMLEEISARFGGTVEYQEDTQRQDEEDAQIVPPVEVQ